MQVWGRSSIPHGHMLILRLDRLQETGVKSPCAQICESQRRTKECILPSRLASGEQPPVLPNSQSHTVPVDVGAEFGFLRVSFNFFHSFDFSTTFYTQ